MSRLDLSPRPGRLRCVYCRDHVDRNLLMTCPDCQAVYHEACIREHWEGHGPRCATRGCRAALVVPSAVVPREASAPVPVRNGGGRSRWGPAFLVAVLLLFLLAGVVLEIPAMVGLTFPVLGLMAHSVSRGLPGGRRPGPLAGRPGPEAFWTGW